MGEVFRARDTRLNRDVAVKVLPKDFVSDADRLRRFEQEAKTLAALNHPRKHSSWTAVLRSRTPPWPRSKPTLTWIGRLLFRKHTAGVCLHSAAAGAQATHGETT